MKKHLAYYENEWPANIAELTAVENKPFVGYLKGEGVSYTVIESTAPTFYNDHEYVDLGLPSGTKWATMNVGATSPEQEGVKYDCASRFTADAYEWGGSWSQPSYSDFYELFNTCKNEIISSNGVSMCKLTGPNGKSIYLSVD